jgi:anti-anti-sigma factor
MAGNLHLATIGPVLAALDRVDLDRTPLLVFDLQEVAFIDAAGLTTILRANDYCANHAIHFTVVKPSGFASRVFTLTCVHRVLDLIDSAALGHGMDALSARLDPPRASRRGTGLGERVRPRSLPCSTHPSRRRQL